jgi:capsular polysaccharide biosynthesis protein
VTVYPVQTIESPRFQTNLNRKGELVILSSEPRILKGACGFALEHGIASRAGAIYTSDGRKVISQEGNEIADQARLKSYPMLLPSFHRSDEPVAAISVSGFNYFHWLFDVLPKIHLLEKLGFPDSLLYVHVTTEVQAEMLKILGVKESRILNSANIPFVRAPQLIVPFFLGQIGACKILRTEQLDQTAQITLGNSKECVNLAGWACEFLRDRFLPVIDSDSSSPRRIFISRKDARKGRSIRNEEKVLAFLKEYGFEEVSLTGLRFVEQARLFHNAEIILAPHGASLANLVFCQTGVKCIEIFSPQYISDLYAVLSNLVGLEYFYIVGQGRVDQTKSNEDYDIDVADLQMLFQKAGVTPAAPRSVAA